MAQIETYFFYCWTSVNKDTKTAIGPFVVAAETLKNWFPEDKSEFCEWSECKFTIDLETYSISKPTEIHTKSSRLLLGNRAKAISSPEKLKDKKVKKGK